MPELSADRDTWPPNCVLCGESESWEPVVSPAIDHKYGVVGSWAYFSCRSCGLVVLHPHAPSHADAYPASYRQHHDPIAGSTARTGLRQSLRSLVLGALGYGRDRGSILTTVIGRPCASFGAVRLGATWGFLLFPRAHTGGRLLDVGCGNGRFLTTMATLGWEVYGIEPDPTSAVHARMVVPGTIVQGGLRDACFPAGSFDVITMNHVIEHLSDPLGDLRILRGWCAPGGRLGIATPNFSSLTRHLFAGEWYALEPPRHTVLFRPRSLRTMVEASGFRVTALATPSTREAAESWRVSWRFRHRRQAPPSVVLAGTAASLLTAPLGAGEEIELWAEPAA